jgi:hypothetical protein
MPLSPVAGGRTFDKYGSFPRLSKRTLFLRTTRADLGRVPQHMGCCGCCRNFACGMVEACQMMALNEPILAVCGVLRPGSQVGWAKRRSPWAFAPIHHWENEMAMKNHSSGRTIVGRGVCFMPSDSERKRTPPLAPPAAVSDRPLACDVQKS